jgi:lysophospholipase L1-like esterase
MTMHASTLRFLALGDSYTVGEGVPPSACWPVQLVSILRREAYPIDDPILIAQTGWTSDELLAGMAAAPELEGGAPYDLVSLLIGVNDQYRGRRQDEYRVQFVKLLDRAVALARDDPFRVIVLSIPDWGVTPFAAGRNRDQIAAEIDNFNAVNREAAKQAGVHYIDVTSISRQAVHDSSLLASDGLHPSGNIYTCWAAAVLPIARQALVSAR